MNASYAFRHLIALLVGLALTSDGVALSQQPGGIQPGSPRQSELRWTPHRAATAAAASPNPAPSPAVPGAPGAPGAPDTSALLAPNVVSAAVPPAIPETAVASTSQPPAAAASVGLPPDVPKVVTARRPGLPASQRPDPRLGNWDSPNRTAGRFRPNASEPRLPLPKLDDIQVFRAPQGERGRPILGIEGAQQRPVTTPVGGGMAPRFQPDAGRTATTAAGRRPERLALNTPDGLPSVMTKAPQAAAIEGAQLPNRLPAPSAAGGVTRQTPPAAGNDTPIIIESVPPMTVEPGPESYGVEGYSPDMMAGSEGDDGLWMGEYPAERHVESFYDDQFACEEGPWLLPCCPCDGRICAWLRRFGKPYYGWRWYRDFTASAGIAAFENQSNLGLFGNYGTNEYINWAMPFWNAFGIGWQLGVRGVQSNFQPRAVTDPIDTVRSNARDQVFVTTGFFTRAFEGRGLQGGAAYDYLSDSYFENVDVAQIRGELSYVWGYHELGFWGAFNTTDQLGTLFRRKPTKLMASTVNLYTAFYRIHFGDANEARIWGGASDNGQGVVGTTIRAPMSRSLAMEGAFTYLLPSKSETFAITDASSVTFAPSAWNLAVNLVWYPAGRARRSLASPYRPLFDVADNGSMIRAISR